MNAPQNYDAIVIGGSAASVGHLCPYLAQAGWRTALVERAHLGGTCVNVGCMPTKTMAASARVSHIVSVAGAYGVQTASVNVDMARVQQRTHDLVLRLRKSEADVIEKAGVDLIRGEARFTAPKSLEVRLTDGSTRQLSANAIVIDTGARPARPTILGLATVPALDSTSILDLDILPDHLLVLGGGYVGVEFSQMFRRFGANVTIVQSGRQLLAREDPDVAEAVTTILREDGIDVLLQAETRQITAAADGQIQLTVGMPGVADRILTGSHLLLATGRVPNTERLNLKVAGIDTDSGGAVRVNDRLETTVSGVYALGDAKGGPAFTHVAFDDARILRTNLLKRGMVTTTGRLVPYTIFIDPQLGRVGLTETEALAQGYTIHVATLPMANVLRAMDVGETRGMMKVVVDAKTDQILGAAILGIEGGEVMTVVHVAMMGKLPYTALRDGVICHPTLAEGLTNLLAAVDG